MAEIVASNGARFNTTIDRENIKFYSVDEVPFGIYGIYRDGDKYRRIPADVAKSVSDGVLRLSANTAGGRVRFVTDSPYVAIHVEYGTLYKSSHFPFTGSIGFDLYVDNRYTNTFRPPYDVTDTFDGLIGCSGGMHEITVNFPLYSDVKALYIGLDADASVAAAKPYRCDRPVVYYGSSITQGGCASRPGMAYQSIVSRELDLDHINLGFSGNAKGEDAIVEYISGLSMSVLVMDYDHNAPTAAHLSDTHEKMYKTVRAAQPELPILIMSRPKYRLTDDEIRRREIVEATYRNAVAAGDKNVYFLDGAALCELCLDEGTVDNTHPTDFGFASMAKAVCDVIGKLKL